MSFLLDTDTCSMHLKRGGMLTSRFLQHAGRLHVSVITVGELFTWASRAKAPASRVQSLSDFLRDVRVLEVTMDVGRKFGELRAALLDLGRPAPGFDLLIAATALVHGLTVVTHNVADFANVPGLAVVDWLAP